MSNSTKQTNKSNDEVFNEHWHHTQLMAADNYVGTEAFPELGIWLDRDAFLGDLFVVRDTADPVYCIIVGLVSAENIRMQAHGNYSKSFDNMKFSGSKMQLTIKKPVNTIYEADFDLAIKRLEAIQAAIAVGNAPSKYFIIRDDKNNKCLRMSYPIFEHKNKSNDSPARRMLTGTYPIGSDFKDEMQSLVNASKFHVRPLLRVHRYGVQTALKLKDFESELAGALVEITFSLKHYTMGANTPGGPTNTFSGAMHQVLILQDAPPPAISPFDEDQRQGPLRLRQESPKKRKRAITDGDQIAAAQVFGPAPAQKLHEFIQGSSASPHISPAPSEETVASDEGANDKAADVPSKEESRPKKRTRAQ
ncbi:hypothetical protein BDN70DRAFT_938047 [Pholiota conissans]|uniref:Uncharacterized protein n=1 Tax=Pholiota conissans TaxID=109636 RepID=A0A9P5YS21_9AGAR|nr:hypothetical protein BDN70DRAFT_938047 [Pholiota conissans]